MAITPEQFRSLEVRLQKNQKTVAPLPTTGLWPWPCLPLAEFTLREFDFHGPPVGKPRMTQRDVWKKRPIVLRYHVFKDALRAAAGEMPPGPDAVIVTAHVPMPPSWSKKKQAELAGKPCRQKPDWDNIGKAVCDTLFEEDACIWCGATVKYWCPAGQEGLNVKVLYAKPQ